MRNHLPVLVSVFHVVVCPLFAGEIPEPFLPEGITFGMTCEAVQSARPTAFKPEIAVNPLSVVRSQIAKDETLAHANIAVLMDSTVNGNPVVIRTYYFSSQKLAAVMYASAYSIPPTDGKPLFQDARSALDRHFEKQADERTVRLSADMLSAEERFIESWKDPEGETIVFFEVENNALRCVIYDPNFFSKSDFYMDDSDVETFAPIIQAGKKTLDKHRPELGQIEKRRQEEIRRTINHDYKDVHEQTFGLRTENGNVSLKTNTPLPVSQLGDSDETKSAPWKTVLLVGAITIGGAIMAWLYFRKKGKRDKNL